MLAANRFLSLTPAIIAEGAAALASRDPVLAELYAQYGRPPVWRRPQCLRTLVLIILEQKVSLVSARAVMRRVDALAGKFTAAEFLAIPIRSLRTAGVSGRKIEYCRSTATCIKDGTLVLAALRKMSDEAAMLELQKIRGVGPWTSSVYVTMALARQDAWASGDRALAVSYQESWGLDHVPTYEALDGFAERWSPWRGVASRLLWHAYLSKRRNARA